MKGATTYLTFDGDCREAMEFYKDALGGDLTMMTFKEGPEMPALPEGSENRIMHACLMSGPVNIMASDCMPGMPFSQGNNFSITIQCEDVPETEKLFNGLSRQAQKIQMPPAETFWATRYAMFTDRFGVNWMLNLSKPVEAMARK